MNWDDGGVVCTHSAETKGSSRILRQTFSSMQLAQSCKQAEVQSFSVLNISASFKTPNKHNSEEDSYLSATQRLRLSFYNSPFFLGSQGLSDHAFWKSSVLSELFLYRQNFWDFCEMKPQKWHRFSNEGPKQCESVEVITLSLKSCAFAILRAWHVMHLLEDLEMFLQAISKAFEKLLRSKVLILFQRHPRKFFKNKFLVRSFPNMSKFTSRSRSDPVPKSLRKCPQQQIK